MTTLDGDRPDHHQPTGFTGHATIEAGARRDADVATADDATARGDFGSTVGEASGPRSATHGTGGGGVIASVADGVQAIGAGRATTFAIANGRDHLLDAEEVRRVERALGELIGGDGSLPTVRALATRSGVPRRRLRQAIGSVGDAVSALIDERFAMARACNDMSTGWHPSISVLAGRLVTHRLFVYRVLADALPMIASCPRRAGQLVELERVLDDELGYQVSRLGLFDHGRADDVIGELSSVLSIGRVRELDTGEHHDLERRLNADVADVLERYEAYERWNERRHDWFAPLGLAPPAGRPVATPLLPAPAGIAVAS